MVGPEDGPCPCDTVPAREGAGPVVGLSGGGGEVAIPKVANVVMLVEDVPVGVGLVVVAVGVVTGLAAAGEVATGPLARATSRPDEDDAIGGVGAADGVWWRSGEGAKSIPGSASAKRRSSSMPKSISCCRLSSATLECGCTGALTSFESQKSGC